jgi:ribokinase
MSKKILVIGSSNTDMVVKTTRFPQPGETIIGGDFFMFPGGKGANQAVAAARMGGDVCFICKTGDDLFGRQAEAGFRQEGIHTQYILKAPDLASGVALITVDASGENEIVVAPGANNALLPADLDAAAAAFKAASVLLIQLEIPLDTVVHAIQKAHRIGQKTILNPAPARPLPDDLYPCLWLITPNETEAELLTGIQVQDADTAARAATVLLEKGVQNVLITLGAKGAFFMNHTEQLLIPTPKVTAVDTTAAGDVFNGALAVAISDQQGWQADITLACKAAAISVTRMGAQASAPYRAEVL